MKASNLLISRDGTILLGDFGVVGDLNVYQEHGLPSGLHFDAPQTLLSTVKRTPSSSLRSTDHPGKRNSLVGTVRGTYYVFAYSRCLAELDGA